MAYFRGKSFRLESGFTIAKYRKVKKLALAYVFRANCYGEDSIHFDPSVGKHSLNDNS